MEGIIQTAVIVLNLSDIIRNNSNEIYYIFLENAGVHVRWTKAYKSVCYNL